MEDKLTKGRCPGLVASNNVTLTEKIETQNEETKSLNEVIERRNQVLE